MKKSILYTLKLISLTLFLSSVCCVASGMAKEKVVLSITGEDISWVVDKFNKSQSEYQVVVQNMPYKNWRHAVNRFRYKQTDSSSAGNKQIDIAFIDNNWLMEVFQVKWPENLTDKINNKAQFIDGLLEASSDENGVYALPFSNKGLVLFYRKDMHDKYGLKAPQTLDQLEKNAMVLIEKENLSHGITIHYSAIHLDILPFLWSNGGGILRDNRIVLNSKENIETLSRIQHLAQKKILPSPEIFAQLKTSYGNAKKLFIAGKSAYVITWNNRITDFENSDISDNFGVLPIPPIKTGQPSFSVIGTWYFAINANSKHKQGAIQFLNYFYTDDVQLYMGTTFHGFLPATKHMYQNQTLNSKNKFLGDLKLAMSNMRHRLRHPDESKISLVLENAIREIIINKRPVREILDIAQNRIGPILDKK